ncbi:MAG: PQQ-dependent sugar dehydrogenase [Deltaproteobacteria bacterium]|nr:PQQ-dependent sugar dehydrogenase [Deltaproteobacteria bacterium]MBW2414645.1 PQQ-dependent sugar dehydrogenase [Deltaproteobacteria bacterium]
MLFGADVVEETELQRRIELPPGFRIDTFATGLRNARFMRFSGAGDLLVSSPREGTIFLLEPDRDGDGATDGQRVLLDGLNRPHGFDFHEGWLYVGETDAIRRIRFNPETGAVDGELEPVVTGLPEGGNHWTKTVRFGPDGWMYVSVGSSCNVCDEEDERRAAMLRFRPDGSDAQVYARGLRNSAGFDFHPRTGELWATDNGRDLLGDDFPPCEFNRVVEGADYGWPYANGMKQPDPDFGAGRDAEIAASVAPEHGFVAHTAPLGMTFYRGEGFPARYRGAAFVAQHGSWNRSTKSGYRVVLLEWDDAGTILESDFAVGFEKDEQVIGRPVDVAEGPDGALYVSDDYTGAVYRIEYAGAD